MRGHAGSRQPNLPLPEPGAVEPGLGIASAELEPFYDRFEYLTGTSGKAGHLNGKKIPGANPFEESRSREYPASPQTALLPMLPKDRNFILRTPCQVHRVNLDSSKTRAAGVTCVDGAGRQSSSRPISRSSACSR